MLGAGAAWHRAGVGPPGGQSDEFVGGVQQLFGGTVQTSSGDVEPPAVGVEPDPLEDRHHRAPLVLRLVRTAERAADRSRVARGVRDERDEALGELASGDD